MEPDWAYVSAELKRKGVTLTLLWQEYRESHPDGYAYTRFCTSFRAFERRTSARFRHRLSIPFIPSCLPTTAWFSGTHHFEPVDFVIDHGRGRHDAYSAGSCQRSYARACGCRQRPEHVGIGTDCELDVPERGEFEPVPATPVDPEVAARSTLYGGMHNRLDLHQAAHLHASGGKSIGSDWEYIRHFEPSHMPYLT